MFSSPLKKASEEPCLESERTSSFRSKPFSAILEIDPDEKKKKKEENSPPSVFHLPPIAILAPPLLVEKVAHLQEISLPIAEKISLQKAEGRVTTHFVIQTKYFDELEITLTLYDTAPDSFHILILGNKKIAELLMQHQTLLSQQIQTKLPHIKIHIESFGLKKAHRFVQTKKKSVENSNTSRYSASKEGYGYDS